MNRTNPLVLFVLLVVCVCAVRASGPMAPEPLLSDGGNAVAGNPEFYSAIELRVLAQKYRDKFPEYKRGTWNGSEETTLADEKDYEAAIREKNLVPPDVELAKKQNKEARAFLDSRPDAGAQLPEEYPSEFRDYHVGALAFCRKDWDGARKAFAALLARPAKERHYRTTWALYMLARIALENEEIIARCREVRKAAAEGFADTTDCVSASYRMEERYNKELAGECGFGALRISPSARSLGAVPC